MDTNTNSMINSFITVCYEDDYDSDNGIYNGYDVDKNATEIQLLVF